MALSPEMQAALDDLHGLDVQKELLELRAPKAAPVVAPKGAAPVAAPAPVAEAPGVLDGPQVNGDPNSFSSALGRGVDNLQANAWGTVQAVGEASGSQYLKDLGTQGVTDNKDQAAQYGVPTDRSYKDVNVTDPSSIAQYTKNLVGEALPSLGVSVGSSLAGGIAGAKAGAMAPGLIGKVGGTVIGGFLGSMGINVGAVQNQMKELDPNSEHPWTAILTGAGLSTLDAVGAKAIAGPLMKHFGQDAAYAMLRQSGMPKATALEGVTQALKSAGIGAVAEGGTSAAQSVIQDVVAGNTVGKPLSPSDVLDHAIDAALGGAAVGTVARAGTSLADHIMTQADSVGSAIDRSGVLGKVSEAAGKVGEKIVPANSLLRTIWQTLGSESTAKLDPLADVSPAAKEFRENFRADMTGERSSKRTIFEDQDITAAKWSTKYDDITRGMKAKDVDALFQEVSQPKATLQSQKAKDLRGLMDEVHADAINRGGLKVNYLDGMMPFQINPKKLNTPEAFAAFRPYFKDDAATAAAIQNYTTKMANPETRGNMAPKLDNTFQTNPQTGAWETIPQFQKGGDPESLKFSPGQGDTVPKYGHLEESRAFPNVPQHVLNKYALNTSTKAKARELKEYFEGSAHRIAFAERFGASGEKANFQIAKAVKEAQDAGHPVTSEQLDRMFDLVNSYNGMYGRIKNEKIKNAAGIVSGITVMSRLPLSGISTLTELAVPFAKAGVFQTLSAVLPTFAEAARQGVGKIIKSVPPSETGRTMRDLGMTLESATSLAADRLGTQIWNSSIQKATRLEFLVNGMSVMTHFNRIFAMEVAKKTYQNSLGDLAGGLPFSSANGANKLAQLREMGIDVKDQADALSLIAPSSPSERMRAAYMKDTAMKRFVNQSVLEPTFADKPMWMNNGLVGMMGLLKGYPAAYGNIIFPMMMRRMSPFAQGSSMKALAGVGTVAFTMGLMMALGAVQDELKTKVKGAGSDWQDTRTPSQRAIDIGSQQLPLPISLAINAYTSARKGYSISDEILGPTAGIGTDIARGIKGFADDPSAGHIAKLLYQQTPLRPFKGIQEKLIDEPFGMETK